MTRQVRFSNLAVSKLASPITASSTTITLQTGDGAKFPALTGSQYFMCNLIKSDGTTEVVKVTARSSDTLTVVRAAEAVAGVQTAYAFSTNDRIEHRLTAGVVASELDRLDQAAYINPLNKSANYTVTSADVTSLIRVNTASNAVTITLPDIATLTDDFDVIVAKVTGDTNIVTIARASTDTINGATSYSLTNQWQAAWLTADRSTGTWTVISSGQAGVKANVDTFTGSGTAGPFTLSGDPGIKENTAVYVGGVYQQKSTYTLTGADLTLGGTVAAGVPIEVIWAQPLQVGYTSANQVAASDGASGSLWTTVQGFIDKLKSSVGASLVGFKQSGAGAVQRTVQDKMHEVVSVKDFGAVGDGVTDDTAAIQAALLAAAGSTLRVTRGTYKVTDGLTLSGLNSALVCEPGTIFDFTITGNTTDCLTLDPSGYEPLHIENLTLKCNNTGRDGIAFVRGAPKFTNVTINQPYRDGIAATLNSSSSQWVENLTAYNLFVTAAGRHAFHVYMTGTWNGTPFFNETLIEQFEVRGIGRNFASASAIRFTFDGTTAAPVSGFTLLQSNFDAQVSSAVAPVSHTIYAASVNGGVGRLESFFIKGGGWESTSGAAPGGLLNLAVDSGVAIVTSTVANVVNYQWGFGVASAFAAENSNFYSDANGANYPRALPNASGVSFQANGGLLSGFLNNPTAFRTRDFLVQSGNRNIDISIGTMSDFSAQPPIVVTIFHKGFYDSLGFYGYGVYLVSPSRKTTNYVDSVLMLSGTSNAAWSFTPSAVTFSIPSNGTLRVTVPGGASVGTSGASTAFDLSANRMFVDLPGNLTTLTI